MKIHKAGLITALSLIVLWIASALYLLIKVSPVYGLLELIFILILLITVNGTYCRKCPLHKKGCMHFCLGNGARLLRDKSDENYKIKDLLLLISGIVPAIVFPQFFLIQSIELFTGYWVITLITGLLIFKFVCPDCGNTKCLIKKRTKAETPVPDK